MYYVFFIKTIRKSRMNTVFFLIKTYIRRKKEGYFGILEIAPEASLINSYTSSSKPSQIRLKIPSFIGLYACLSARSPEMQEFISPMPSTASLTAQAVETPSTISYFPIVTFFTLSLPFLEKMVFLIFLRNMKQR